VFRTPLSNPIIRAAPTYIVAAYDSVEPGRADFIAPEADALDFITTDVLPELPSSKGSIAFLEGTYICSSFRKPLTIESMDGVTLLGQGAGTAFVLLDGVQSNIIKVVDSDYIRIDGIQLVGSTTAEEDVTLPNQTQNGIFFDGSQESVISNCIVHSNKVFGINLYNFSSYNKVINCIVNSNGNNGIVAGVDSTNNLISGNTCNNNGKNGIRIENRAVECIVANNSCGWSGDHGIYIHRANGVVVSGNDVTGSVQHGIFLDEADGGAVNGNTCRSNGSNGIYLATTDQASVVGNTCYGTTIWNGIYCWQAYRSTITGNTCYSNNWSGIRMSVSENNNIVGNSVYGNTREGIYLWGSCNQNNITGNICVDNDIADTNTYDGICIDNDSNLNAVTGNKCYVTTAGMYQRYGININNVNCDDNFIHGNDIYQAGRTGDYISIPLNTIYHNHRTSAGWAP